MSYIAPVVWLTGLWAILWRSTTPATWVTGVALGIVLTWAVRRSDDHLERHRIHVWPMLKFFGHMVVALIRANLRLGWEIITPDDNTRPGVLEIRLPPSTELELTFIGAAINLTPGTLVLDIDTETSTFWIHILHLLDADEARAEVQLLQRLIAAGLEPVLPEQEAQPS